MDHQRNSDSREVARDDGLHLYRQQQGRDYVRVTLAMTVASADVAGAVVEAWQTFMDTARADPRGRDLTSAPAEAQPEGR